MKKIKIVASRGINGQESIEKYIGKEYNVLELTKYYSNGIIKEMNELNEVAVLLDESDSFPSIINKDEYIFINWELERVLFFLLI